MLWWCSGSHVNWCFDVAVVLLGFVLVTLVRQLLTVRYIAAASTTTKLTTVRVPPGLKLVLSGVNQGHQGMVRSTLM